MGCFNVTNEDFYQYLEAVGLRQEERKRNIFCNLARDKPQKIETARRWWKNENQDEHWRPVFPGKQPNKQRKYEGLNLDS